MKSIATKSVLASLISWSFCVAPMAAPPSPPPKIDILVAKGKSMKFNKTDYDNKTQNFQCKVSIRSKEFQRSFQNLRATLIVIGKQVDGDARQVLDVATSEFNLPPRGEHCFEGSPVTLNYDDHLSAKYGIKYEGFALLIEDAAGAEFSSQATKNFYLQDFPTLRKMAKGTCFDGSLTVIKTPLIGGVPAPPPAPPGITGR